MDKRINLLGCLVAGTIPLVIAQSAWANAIPVTGVQIQSSDNGLELVLETSRTPQVFQTTYGNTLAIDLVNTQLRLPETDEFRQDNPIPSIASIAVIQKYANSIRIIIEGTETAPTAAVKTHSQGISFGVNRTDSVAETPSPAEESPEETTLTPNEDQVIELVVTATRTPQEEDKIPRSITTITREEIAEQTTLTQNLGDILGQLVPGFGPPSKRAFTAASLRGRTASILIDGVPLNVNNRDFDRELQTISPDAIERIEVVRGPSAIYGAEATGGIINIITRQPTEDSFTSRLDVGVDAALGGLEGESFGNTLRYGLSGREGNFDYRLNLSRDDDGASFDGEGDRLPVIQGNDESETFNILGKIGLDIGEQQRLEFSANYFHSERDPEIIADPIVNELPGKQKARALEVGELEFPTGGGPQRDRNTVLNLSYNHEDLWGSQLTSQLYYRDNITRADPRDRRPGAFGIFQGELDSQNWGGRLGLETPLTEELNLLWGADYDEETTSNTFNLFDPEAFDASNGRVNRRIEQRVLVPNYDLNSIGLFAQAQWAATERLQVNGGLRYENVDFAVDDYTTFFGDFIEGGEETFDDVLFNLGAIYALNEEMSLFASFAQGFSVPDFGIVLGFPDPGFVVGSDVRINQPQKVDEYEIGWRGNWDNVQVSLAGFYNESDLGSGFVFNDSTGFFDIVRAPERVYGIEATVDTQVAENWALGGTLSWSEGEADLEDNDDYTPLSSARISPIKVTAYVANETLPSWNNRLQALWVGSRDRAFEEDIDPADIESYIVLDLISSIAIGEGTLQIGIENLLDTFYFPAYSQRTAGFRDTFNSAASGRTISIRYSLTW